MVGKKAHNNKPCVLVVGNLLLPDDNLPLRLLPRLKKSLPHVQFIEADPAEDIHRFGRNPIFLDAAEGVEKVTVVSDVDQIESAPTLSLHGHDLAWEVKLMRKAGMLDSVRIIAVPRNARADDVVEDVVSAVKSLTS
ncbi:Uncharacterised protein [uncultured archaeon]|nr:Uncharacterised protein [uncultured archaeon]